MTKMNFSLAVVISAAFILLPLHNALAQDEEADSLHLEVGSQLVFIDGQDGVEDFNYNTLLMRLVYDVDRTFAIEGEAMVGITDTTVNVPTVLGTLPIETKIRYGIGLFGKASFNPFDSGSLHARIGFMSIEAEVSALGFSVSGTDEGLAYGVGGEFEIFANTSLRLDLTQYRDSGETTEALSMTAVIRL